MNEIKAETACKFCDNLGMSVVLRRGEDGEYKCLCSHLCNNGVCRGQLS